MTAITWNIMRYSLYAVTVNIYHRFPVTHETYIRMMSSRMMCNDYLKNHFETCNNEYIYVNIDFYIHGDLQIYSKSEFEISTRYLRPK